MAKFLYGVSGEGSGHSSRAKEVIENLIKQGHQVKVVSYGRGYKGLNRYFDVEEINGLHFSFKNNKIRYMGTLYKNLCRFPGLARSILRVVKNAKKFQPNIIFSDFEPISCIVANLLRIPLISIDNQHRLTNTVIEVPRGHKLDAMIAKLVIKLMIFNPKAYLVTTFHHGGTADKKTFLFPPILRKEVLALSALEKDFILVYVTSGFLGLIEILKKINAKFIVYGFDRREMDGNIEFKPFSQDGFLRDLADCRAVAASAGFTLISEALHFGKPYLALPINSHFEQIFNAFILEKLGYGKCQKDISKEKIESFISNLDLYKKNLKQYPKEDNSGIFKKINELIAKYKDEKDWGKKT